MQMRAARTMRDKAAAAQANTQTPASSATWTPLGPVPLASDATGTGFQDYGQVSGRATAVAIDPADPSGNTVYIGGAQGGVWKSTNAVNGVANNVTWTPLTDSQATLSVGAIAIQPGNTNPAQSVILVATGEADNSADSYFGLGILRSIDSGSTWNLTLTANSGALSFAGLGGTRMAFSANQTNVVVAAMATSSEGVTDGAVTANTTRGLYTSIDAGQTWNYDALVDPGGATDATSATAVVYNAAANSGTGLFFAAVRYHGFYSSPDGVNWTRLASQPGGAVLSATACPPLSTSNSEACPIYRGEITVVPGRNEMYAWYVSADPSTGAPTDQGIWQSMNGGASWTQISESGVTNCGDVSGCGVDQGFYNLELLAVPNASATDLYAGASNLYKCSITTANLTCSNVPFLNLTHAYGCDPLSALAHVHPDQHALAYTIPTSGSDVGAGLMFFANDGGIYRALNEFTGLATGSCSGTNQFDDLNQNLGSMTQFVSFSQHPTDANTLLGGVQGNGSPATTTATTSSSWGNVLGGDGSYNAIDPNATSSWFASNPDVPPDGLDIQQCSSGINCNDSTFTQVVGSGDLGGDDGAFYFPYILDPQSTTTLLVGTCRVWQGPRLGGTYNVLSMNFDTLGTGACTGSEINLVRALAAGGATNASGSEVVYAATDGLGPLDGPGTSPSGGNVWVSTDATPVTGSASTFVNTTNNGPNGTINPNQFPISSVAIDTSDSTGNTAYVTVMGFTGMGASGMGASGGPGHVWQTTNAGASWTDWSDFGGTAPLPDSPVNAVVVDPVAHIVYVGTDVGVFQSSTAAGSAAWGEVGPVAGETGVLPNVAVTALALFSYNGQKLLRASTYGRGVWQANLVPGFEMAVSNPTQTVFVGQPVTFNGTLTSVDGYNNSVELTCIPGASNPPSPCTPNPVSPTPSANGTPFTLSTGSVLGDYYFTLQGVGSDPNNTTEQVSLTLYVVNFGLTTPAPVTVTIPRGTTSSAVTFEANAQGSFDQSVTVSCSFSPPIAGANCNFSVDGASPTPQVTVNPTSTSPVPVTATVYVPLATPIGTYTVTLQATTSGAPVPAKAFFSAIVTLNPDFILSPPTSFPVVNAGSTGTGSAIGIASQDGFNAAVSLTCSLTTASLTCPVAMGSGSCSVSPSMVSSFPATANVVVNATSLTAGCDQLSVQGTSGALTQELPQPILFNVADYQLSLSGSQSLSLPPNGQGTANLAITPSTFYNGTINATCNTGALAGQCSITPNPVKVTAGTSASLVASVNVPTNAVPGLYAVVVNTQDTSGAPSHSLSIPLTIGQDYSIGNFSPTTQTIAAGQTALPYNFSVMPVGAAYSNAVTLTCTVTPLFAGSCTFSPNPAGPLTDSTAASVVMTVATQTISMQLNHPRGKSSSWRYAAWLVLPGIVVWGTGRRRRCSPATLLGLAFTLILVFFLPSCGSGSNGGSSLASNGQQGTIPGTYTITVTGTPPSSSQKDGSSVTLTIQ